MQKKAIHCVLSWFCILVSFSFIAVAPQAQDASESDAAEGPSSINLQPPNDDADLLVLISRGLDELPAEMFEHDWFTSLSIGNHSTWIPMDKYIKEVDNTYTTLPPEIGNLQQLTLLEITDGNVSELPAQVGNLENLETLILVDLRLDDIPPEIGILEN